MSFYSRSGSQPLIISFGVDLFSSEFAYAASVVSPEPPWRERQFGSRPNTPRRAIPNRPRRPDQRKRILHDQLGAFRRQ
jgi:hypothetical protein